MQSIIDKLTAENNALQQGRVSETAQYSKEEKLISLLQAKEAELNSKEEQFQKQLQSVVQERDALNRSNVNLERQHVTDLEALKRCVGVHEPQFGPFPSSMHISPPSNVHNPSTSRVQRPPHLGKHNRGWVHVEPPY